MTGDGFILGQLALLSWREASRYGGTKSMEAIAHMIAQRVKAGWFGGNWLDNISNFYSYHAQNVAGMEPFKFPDVREPNFRKFIQNLEEIYYGSSKDVLTVSPVGQPGLYCAELSFVNRDWFKENILSKLDIHPITAKVGELTFFA